MTDEEIMTLVPARLNGQPTTIRLIERMTMIAIQDRTFVREGRNAWRECDTAIGGER